MTFNINLFHTHTGSRGRSPASSPTSASATEETKRWRRTKRAGGRRCSRAWGPRAGECGWGKCVASTKMNMKSGNFLTICSSLSLFLSLSIDLEGGEAFEEDQLRGVQKSVFIHYGWGREEEEEEILLLLLLLLLLLQEEKRQQQQQQQQVESEFRNCRYEYIEFGLWE